jgi:hypothetical protein
LVFHNPDPRIASLGEYLPSHPADGGSIGLLWQLLSRAMLFLSKYNRELALPGASSTSSHKNGILPISTLTATSNGASASRMQQSPLRP